jgi:DNA-binding PadR family transcriptional regulator
MNKVKEDLFLHPVRLRLILAIAGRQVTAQQLATELPDIPQASLYRNINMLAAAGFLVVVRERRVHNTIEKTYALPEKSLMLTQEDLKNARPEDYIRLITQFLGMLLGYFARYIQNGDVDVVRDNLLFQMTPFYLNEDEVLKLAKALQTLLRPYLKNEPSPERRRSILGLMFLPDVVGAPLHSERQAITPEATPTGYPTE